MTRRAGYSQPAAAHPRVCGENLVVRLRNAFAVGSSPRVRGKPHARGDRTRVRRLIPARAGKTAVVCGLAGFRRAHPRACGENGGLPDLHTRWEGSSPRVRGKPPWCADWRDSAGLIPARAGKTRPSRPPPGRSPAHPRACGENTRPPLELFRSPGSSPRVRGKPPGSPTPPGRSPAHPRACGENSEGALAAVTTMGSSPRVRGKPSRSFFEMVV